MATLPSPAAVQSVTVYFNGAGIPASAFDNANQTLNNSTTPLEVASNGGQLVATISNLNPVTGLVGNIAAATLTLTKIGSETTYGGEVSLGDVYSLIGNATAVIGTLLVFAGGAPVAVAGFAIAGFTFGVLGMMYNANQEYQKTQFTAAQRWVFPRDPLTLDLDGDGIETVAVSPTNPILFDHDGDGLKNATGWIKPDDGFLVMDRNGNGTIDNGTELFGDSTNLYGGGKAADGFAALAQEDTNNDGKIGSADANFAYLRVWRDLNQNGISESGKLATLASLNIASIDVAKKNNSQPLPGGNEIADLGTYTKTDGSTGTVGEVMKLADVNLAVDTFTASSPTAYRSPPASRRCPTCRARAWCATCGRR